MTLNVIATACVGGKVHGIFESVSLRYNETGRYASMFRLMYSMPDSSPALKAIKADVTNLGGGVLHGMKHLQRIVRLALIRHSAMLFIFVYLPLQVVLLYDIHILCLLEAWQTKFGVYARRWFAALGNLEAFSSLAGLCARQSRLGHAPGRRIGDDVSSLRRWAIRFCRQTARRQRCPDRPPRHVPARHRIEHVRQEHAASRRWRQRRSRWPARRSVPQ